MSATTAYLSIIDRFLDPRSTHSIQRSGENLKFWLVMVTIFYLAGIASIYIVEARLAAGRRPRTEIVIEFMPSPPPEPKIVEKPKLSEDMDQSKAAPSINNVIAKPSNDKSPTSAPLKQLLTKDKRMGGQPLLSPTMKITTTAARQNAAAVIFPNKKINDEADANKKAVVTNSQTQLSKSVSPFNDINNAGPKLGGLGGQEAGPGSGSQTKSGDGGGGNDLSGKGGHQIAMLPPVSSAPAMGNIAPYRRDMLVRIAQKWQPTKRYAKIQNAGNIAVIINIDTGGQLLDCSLVASSGDEKLDKYAIETIEETAFAPLPSWYKGDHLKFKVELAKIEAIKGDI